MKPINPIIEIPAPETLAIIENSSLVGLRVSFNIRVYSLNFNGIVGEVGVSFANRFHFPFARIISIKYKFSTNMIRD